MRFCLVTLIEYVISALKEMCAQLFITFFLKREPIGLLCNVNDTLSLRHRRNLTLVKSVCKSAPKFLFRVLTCVPGFEYAL